LGVNSKKLVGFLVSPLKGEIESGFNREFLYILFFWGSFNLR